MGEVNDIVASLQHFARTLQQTAVDLHQLEQEAETQRTHATTPHDILTAAITQAEARGARQTYENIAHALFQAIADARQPA